MLIRYSSNKGKPVKKAVVYTKNEHNLDKSKIDADALRVITYLRDSGFEAFIVGGAVRDMLLGKTPKDFDIVTNAIPNKIKKLFRNSRIIGKRFRLVHVFFGDKIFEVSTFRCLVDGCTVGNTFGSMEEDVLRRDFTLNALYYDPIKEQIIDYVGGVKDIRKKRIEPVISLKTIFTDDPVRMIRAIKYAASTGFHLPFALSRKIRKSAYLLGPVSPSRITEEIIKIVNSGVCFQFILKALETDVFMHIQPSACALLYADKNFYANYMKHIKELDALHCIDPEARLGQRLVYLIEDFVASLTDWPKEIKDNPNVGELYNKTWKQCRHFVLPMNPPRAELEFAIRTTLKNLGVTIRIPKNAFLDKEKNEVAANRPQRTARVKKAPVTKNAALKPQQLGLAGASNSRAGL